ncbi:MAG: hypothetical protein EOP07_12660 [Proteobacteria bacterium]|nr:MAG: hypothetical protein EOP07_12660 [Pseudomonadota bacterium]
MLIRLMIATLLLASCTNQRPGRPHMGGKEGATPGTIDGNPNPTAGSDPDDQLTLSVVESRGTVRMQSFVVLINKLKVVTSSSDSSAAIVQANKISQSLGSYDHAAGVLPENIWTLDKMSSWLQIVDLACRTPALLTQIQATGGEKLFIENAYGRSISSAETTMLDDLKTKLGSANRRARVLCTAVLSSGEFISL